MDAPNGKGYISMIRGKDKFGFDKLLYMSKRNNIISLGLTETYKRLLRPYNTIPMPKIYYSEVREKKRRQQLYLAKATTPMDERSYWWMYHNNDEWMDEFEALKKSDDVLNQYKSIAILDQLNSSEIPCYYCGLPFSGFSSHYLYWILDSERDIEDEYYGVEFGAEWMMCSFCVGLDYTEIWEYDSLSLSLIDNTKGDRGYADLLKPGDASIELLREGQSIDYVCYIRNYYDIMAATSIEEIEAITKQWVDDSFEGTEFHLKMRMRK